MNELNIIMKEKLIEKIPTKLSAKEYIKLFDAFLLFPSMEMLTAMYNNEIDINKADSYLLRHSCKRNEIETVKYCLSKLKKPIEEIKDDLNWGLKEAVKNNHNEIIYFLLDIDCVNPRTSNNEPIRMAAKNNNEELFKHLLENEKVILTAKKNSVIRHLTKNNNLELIKYTLNYTENNLNESERLSMVQGIFCSACENDNQELVSFAMKQKGFAARKNNNSALKLAARRNNIELIDFVLSGENKSMKEIISALIRVSCEKGHLDLYKLLTEKYEGYPYGRQGANFKSVIESDNLEFSLLLLNDDNYNHASDNNYALKKAIYNKNYSLIKALINKKSIYDGLNSKFYSSLNEYQEKFFKRFKNIDNF
jgi:hypothetical protein